MNFLPRRRCGGRLRRGLAQRRFARSPRLEFIGLGQHQAIGDGRAVEQLHHRQVAVHHAAPRIDQTAPRASAKRGR